jgi:phenylacetate-coenzyme A ligase PaaK-like adenylate-forming protein
MNERGAWTTRLISSVLFPLHERFKGHDTVRVHRRLEESQWLSTREIAERQAASLRQFLTGIQSRVPYYRELFASLRFDPERVGGPADLASLPLLTKEVIRSRADALRSEGATRLVQYSTGGSTGRPLVFPVGRERISHDVAAKWRATRWWNVDIGDPEVVVWSSPIEVGRQDWVRMVRDRLLRTTLLSAFEMSPERIDQYLAAIRAGRPRMLFGYPSALAHIARHAERRGVRMDDLGIRVAFVTAELLYGGHREQIERTFGCPVANGYGGRDAGFVAHECPEGRMHVTAEDIVVEILDNAGRPTPSGTVGEIVVTHLASADFPFVRYVTGDVGALDDSPCPCGRGLPLLKSIEGRSNDFLLAKDGRVMHAAAVTYAIRSIPEVEAFQVVQERLEFTRVLVVAHGPWSAERDRAIEADLKARLGEEVTVQVQRVDSIPTESSGKHRFVRSLIADEHRGRSRADGG